MVAAVAPAPSQVVSPNNSPTPDSAAQSLPGAGNSPSFAAVMQRQMGRPTASSGTEAKATSAATPRVATQAANEESQDIQDVATDLAALLPFLEAAGLVPPTTPASPTNTPEDNQAATEPLLPVAPEMQALATAAITPATLPADTVTQAAGDAPATPTASAPQLTTPGAAPAIIAAPQTGTPASTAATAPDAMNSGETTVGEQPGDGTKTFAAELATMRQAQATEQPSPAGEAVQAEAMPQTTANAAPTPGTAAVAAGQAGDAAATQRANASPQLQVAAPVASAQWAGELGDKVVWMAHRQEGRAEMVLNPPQMGRIEVSLSVSGDQASAVFSSTNPVVRDALEAAMPRLREVLADAGIQLGQAQVGAENARQFAQQEKNADNFAAGRHAAATDSAASASLVGGTETQLTLKAGRGLVDVFA